MKRVVLTATGGGHLEQIKQLDSLRDTYEILYLVARTRVNRSMQNVHFVPECRNETHFLKYWDTLKIFFVSFRFLRQYKPDVVISTGANSTFPVCWLQKKVFKKKVIFIESFAKKRTGTKTGKLIYPFADAFIIQSEELRSVYPNAIYGGMIY